MYTLCARTCTKLVGGKAEAADHVKSSAHYADPLGLAKLILDIFTPPQMAGKHPRIPTP